MYLLRLIFSFALLVVPIVECASNNTERIEAAIDAIVVSNLDDVRGNLFLPVVSDGLPVTWESDQTTIITSDGIVHRQAVDTNVILTASIEYEGVQQQRELIASVREAANIGPFEGYAFSYFTNNSRAGENIFFAASVGNNALQWSELNGRQPVVTSSLGTKGLRDPFLIRSPEGDTFYLIATDLSIGSGTSWTDAVRIGSRYLEVWESHDLKTWSEQRHVLVSPSTAGNTWAPEAFYDEEIGAYVVFWASSLYEESDTNHTGSTYHRMLYATTRDFVTFTSPETWQDAGMSRIDSTVIKADEIYFRFTKDEGASGTGCSDIIQERSDSLRATLPSWTIVDSCIGRKAGTSNVEGPTSFKSNEGDVNGEKFYLFVDEYTGRGYIPLETTDIGNPNWTVPSSFALPASPRHGTVIPVTAAELTFLTGNALVSREVNVESVIVSYDFTSINGDQLLDVSGNGKHALVLGNAATNENAIIFDGSDDYIQLPNDLLAEVANITIEVEVKLDQKQQTPYFIFGIGNTVSSNGNGYIFTTGSPYRTSIATGNWTTEQTVSSGSQLPLGSWVHLVYTLEGNTAIIYLNGYEVAKSQDISVTPGDIGNGQTTANYIGRSLYSGDRYLKGEMRKFAIYSRAFDAAEALQRSGNIAAITEISLIDSSVLKVDPIVDADLQQVLFAVVPGSDVTALAPTFSTTEGVASSPVSGTVVDLSSYVTYVLSQGTTEIAEWTMKAVEMRSPVLPGLYADPNAVVFNKTYYIYVTTDGFAGWGGKEFYVWKSNDLVDWVRGEQPFLTLDGENGNVPWASGNAWAPTIIERDGKYFFYFSGHNPTYNTKTIGVAIADAPEGPFTAQPKAMILNNEAVTASQAIDPAAFLDPVSGTYYLFWGNSRPLVAEFNEDMISLKWETAQVMEGLVDFREGLFVVYREGLYHLTYSIDDTGSENYRVGYATSANPVGPWEYHGDILEKDPSQGILGTGHNSMFKVPNTDDWYIVYHRFAIPGGGGFRRETTIDRISFDLETGLIQPVRPTLTSVEPQIIT